MSSNDSDTSTGLIYLTAHAASSTCSTPGLTTITITLLGMVGSKNDGPSYPKPFVVEPRKDHKQSLILLHGQGSNGEQFGSEFLVSETTLEPPGVSVGSGPAVFASMFQHAKFVFPTARKRRARRYNRATINQWFDGVPIDAQDAGMSKVEEEWQLEGLRQSRAYVKAVVNEEVNLVGAANVFIGGISQGCAIALHVLLSYEELPPLGGFVGMSGWLPFADAVEAIIYPQSSHKGRQDGDEDDDPFDASSDVGLGFETEQSDGGKTNISPPSPAMKVCNFIRDNMDLPPIDSSSQPSWLSTPLFLGHGKSDQKVKVGKGFRASDCLKACELEVTWKEYDEGHWYKVPEEVDDIVEFLQACLLRQQV